MQNQQDDFAIGQAAGGSGAAGPQREGSSPVANLDAALTAGQVRQRDDAAHVGSLPSNTGPATIPPGALLLPVPNNATLLVSLRLRNRIAGTNPDLNSRLSGDEMFYLTAEMIGTLSEVQTYTPGLWSDLLYQGFPSLYVLPVFAPSAPQPETFVSGSATNVNTGNRLYPSLDNVEKNQLPQKTGSAQKKSGPPNPPQGVGKPVKSDGAKGSSSNQSTAKDGGRDKGKKTDKKPVGKHEPTGQSGPATSKDAAEPVDPEARRQKILTKIFRSLHARGKDPGTTRMHDLGTNQQEVDLFFRSVPDSFLGQLESRKGPYLEKTRFLRWVELGKPKEGFPATSEDYSGPLTPISRLGSWSDEQGAVEAREGLRSTIDKLGKGSAYPHPHGTLKLEEGDGRLPSNEWFAKNLRRLSPLQWQRLLRLPGIPAEFFHPEAFVRVDKKGIEKKIASPGPWATVSIRLNRQVKSSTVEEWEGYRPPTGSAVTFSPSGTAKVFMTLRRPEKSGGYVLICTFARDHLLTADDLILPFLMEGENRAIADPQIPLSEDLATEAEASAEVPSTSDAVSTASLASTGAVSLLLAMTAGTIWKIVTGKSDDKPG